MSSFPLFFFVHLSAFWLNNRGWEVAIHQSIVTKCINQNNEPEMMLSSPFLHRLGKATVFSTAVVGTAAVLRYNNVRERQNKEWPQNQITFPTNSSGANPDVIIIGAGVVGIATAYTCAQQGQRVLIIEPNSTAGQECTSCAAGGMQRSNPVVNYDTWCAVVKATLLRQGYQFFHIDWWSTLTDPFFLRWIFTFTINSLFTSNHEDQLTKQQEQLKFTAFAVNEMKQFIQKNRHLIQATGYNPTGSLSLSYDKPSSKDTSSKPKDNNNENNKDKAHPTASTMNLEPCRILSTTAEILKVEPSLRFQTQNPPQTAKFEYQSTAASAERYTTEFAKACIQHGNVTFLYNTRVHGVSLTDDAMDTTSATATSSTNSHKKDNHQTKKNPQSVTTIHTTAGMIKVAPHTQVVVTAGAWIPRILATCDLYVPVYPLKGYALSLSARQVLQESSSSLPLRSSDLPSRIVADAYMYTSRLGDEIRITSIGEFSGWSTQPTPTVDKAFRQEAARQFPQLATYLSSSPTRCGHRPYVNDGLVLLGRCPEVQNLYISCGPGSNGWKMAMGSAAVLQRLLAGQSEADVSKELGFDVRVFAPTSNNRVVVSPWFTRLCRARWNV
jgi:glycine/D-amino acid oxidase-like deaminating enzyme